MGDARFWVNWVEDTSGGFYYKYETLQAAREEAERLARQPQNKGSKVYVMECVGWCEVLETPILWYDVSANSAIHVHDSTEERSQW